MLDILVGDARAWRVLHDYPFPGNVRELAWVIDHAVIASEGGLIDVEHLPAALTRPGAARKN